MQSMFSGACPPSYKRKLPYAIVQLSQSKITREISSADPSLRQLVACSNTLKCMSKWFHQELQGRSLGTISHVSPALKHEKQQIIDVGVSWTKEVALDGGVLFRKIVRSNLGVTGLISFPSLERQ